MVFRAACILRHRIHEYTVKFRRRVEADNLPPRLDALLPSISEAPIYFTPGNTSGSQSTICFQIITEMYQGKKRYQNRFVYVANADGFSREVFVKVHPTAFLTLHDFCADVVTRPDCWTMTSFMWLASHSDGVYRP
jgi:hypothetical protein